LHRPLPCGVQVSTQRTCSNVPIMAHDEIEACLNSHHAHDVSTIGVSRRSHAHFYFLNCGVVSR